MTAIVINGSGEMGNFYLGSSIECFFIWQNGFRGEDFFRYRTNQKQELPMAGMFVNGSGRNAQSL